MRHRLLALAVALLPGLASAQPAPGARRFALVIGVNDGGAARLRLRYAASDAKAIAQVLTQLGGVADSDMLVLLDPDRSRILSRLDELARRLGEAKAGARRLEVILYYSGHSDEEGLLVRDQRIAYAELRGRLDALPADLRVAILDSCASGAMTRSKGGTQRPAFLLDASSSLKGHAFLTSSAADEVAQESDRVGGSFFTHYLLSAMRGAADFNRSGRVTLTDAYGFAFQETLARTQRTQGGAQHPSYDIQLQGTGDLVLTDLRSTKAGLLLGKDVAGRVYVHDEEDRLVVELRKQPGRDVELGLSRGSYRIAVEGESGGMSEARLVLEDGRIESLDASGLHVIRRELAMARGASADNPRATTPVFRSVPVAFSVLPNAGIGIGKGGGFIDNDTTNRFAFNLTVGRGGSLSGLEISLLGSWRRGDVSGVQLAVGGNATEGDLHGLAVSDIFNMVRGDLSGAQISGAANWVDGAMKGVQSAFGFNHAGGVSGGWQTSTGANLVAGSFSGLQLSVGYNSAVELNGLQLSVGANHAGTMSGVQLATAANVADDVTGVQIGLVNVGRHVRGLQLGLINVAQSSSGSVGLLNFISDGIHDIAGEYDELGPAVVGRLGGRHVYTLLFLGSTSEKGIAAAHLKVGGTVAYGAGLGFHASAGAWPVDVELLTRRLLGTQVTDGDASNHMLNTLRVSTSLPLTEKLELVFGPSFNAFFDFDKKFPDFAYGWAIMHPGYQLKLWPGAFAAIRY